jgi:hypothetical protein
MQINKKIQSIVSIFLLLILFSIFIINLGCSSTNKEKETIKKVSNSIVRVITETDDNQILGTAFAIGDPDYPTKHFVTNYHVVEENKDFVYIVYGKSDKIITNVVIYDEKKDIAILEVSDPIEDIAPMILANPDNISVMDLVIMIGYPGMYTNELTAEFEDLIIEQGHITRLNQESDRLMLVHNTVLSRGISGGPLINSNGDVLGINTTSKIQDEQIRSSESISISDLIDLISGENILYSVRNSNNNWQYIFIPIIVLSIIILTVIIIFIIKKINKKNSTKKNINLVEDLLDLEKTHSTTRILNPNFRKIYIVGLAGYFEGKTYLLSSKNFVIGRSVRKSDLTFPNKYTDISGIHCILNYDISKDELYIKDVSTNGTYSKKGIRFEKNELTKINFGTEFYLSTEETSFKITDKPPKENN